MEILHHALLVVHLLGWAALFGGMIVQLRESEKKVNPAMRDGIGTAFVMGLALVGVLEADDADVNNTKIGVKFVVGLAVLALVMANVRKPRISDGLFFAILGLTVANVCVAVFW